MEISQENIEKVVEVLRSKKFDEALMQVSNLSKIAEQLIEQNPELTPEEIGQVFEQQMEAEKNMNIENSENEKSKED